MRPGAESIPNRSQYGKLTENQLQPLANINHAMRTASKLKTQIEAPKPTYTQELPKRKVVKERKKVRQLLRSMLPMEEDQRQFQEEQNFYHQRSRA